MTALAAANASACRSKVSTPIALATARCACSHLAAAAARSAAVRSVAAAAAQSVEECREYHLGRMSLVASTCYCIVLAVLALSAGSLQSTLSLCEAALLSPTIASSRAFQSFPKLTPNSCC
jgi:hypothetical protein